MAQAEEDEEQARLLMEYGHSRMAGGTEQSWCKAVSSGTGSTVLAVLFESEAANPPLLQAAFDRLQAAHPRLRSRLLWIHGRPALSVCPVPTFKLKVLPAEELLQALSMESLHVRPDDAGDDDARWLELVERELNMNSEWKERHHCLDPQAMAALTLYVDIPLHRKNGEIRFGSLLAFRLHTAICDRASAGTILRDLVGMLSELRSSNGCMVVDNLRAEPKPEEQKSPTSLAAIEDVIPKGQADKPFWAHGIDILGYSLGSRRHAMLPFENVEQPDRHSEIILKNLTAEDTQRLLKECKVQRTSRLGALTASFLKAAAMLKQLGGRSEHHAVVTLLDCRGRLEPAITSSTIGFYHSAVLNTHLVQGQEAEFWAMARRCSDAVCLALQKRKHFTDMADVGLLMCQAIQMPLLTPWGSLRTSSLVVFEEAMEDDEASAGAMRSVGILDYVGCSSVHGVGPSIAIFDTLRQGALHCTCVYPSPLHSRSQMNQLLNTMVSILVEMG